MDHARFDAITRVIGIRLRRRTAFGLTLGGLLSALGRAEMAAKKGKKNKGKNKKKKSCQKGAKQSGKGCCGAASVCRAGTCFCTGNESPPGAGCVDVASILIGIVTELTGVPAGQIGANPQQPLMNQVPIDPSTLQAIDDQIKEKLLVQSPVPYYTQGIAAGVAVIQQELAVKG